MPRHLHLEPHLTTHDLEARYCGSHDPVERSHWHFLWLLAQRMTATAVARVTGYSAYWIGQIVRRYNRDGPDGVRDRRHTMQARSRVLLSEGEQAGLRAALAAPHPAGDRWCGRTAAAWIGERLGRSVRRQTGWSYLRRVGARWQKPWPRHVRADPAAQAEYVARLRPLLRQVATAFPRARVELWAVDEHRIGLKPILPKVWTLPTFPSQRPQRPIPEHVHLLFLPAHSPELQPAERLWPLTNTVLANQHFASIEELEDAQAERCVALQGRPDLIRSTTRFFWWPQRIHRRRGPTRS